MRTICVWPCWLVACVCYLSGNTLGNKKASSSSDLIQDTPIVATGRCRVHCLKKFASTDVKSNKREREECWKLCLKPVYYKPLCSSKECLDGCQTACNFLNNPPKAENRTVTWRFNHDVITDADIMTIDMSWDPPLPSVQINGPHPIVYTLLMRENNNAWEVIDQTSVTKFKMDLEEAGFVPEFLLQAIDDTGLIAQKIFYVTKTIFTSVFDTEEDEPTLNSPLSDTKLASLEHSSSSSSGSGNVSVDLAVESGGVIGQVRWSHSSPDQSGSELINYRLVYLLNKCGYYEDLPKCRYSQDMYVANVLVPKAEQPHYIIKNMRYNSEYIVWIEVEGMLFGKLRVVTLPCLQPSEDFLTCLDVEGATDIVNTFEYDFEPTPLSILNLIRDVEVRLLNQSATGGQVEPGTVLVNISWNFIADIAKVNFSLSIQEEENEQGMTVIQEDVTGTHVIKQLKDNTVYYVVVDAYTPMQNGEKKYLEDSQQRVHINTSHLSLAVQDLPLAVKLQVDNMQPVDGVIIGVTCVGVVILVTVLMVILYKKRQSFRDIIIPRTVVAKSNSYKSSVGGKADYSNQLMVFSDEWELDVRQLKFSSPLGQGAFGKVLTGYYCERKVAIKLVKEGAPISYKEDLVAEINLMKRLGTHPNIVCLIGAVTLQEPIALVMEYVPYGNLQNFLKKCRLEGDVQKRTDGASEIQYSMLQDCGGIENGVITPTDMLSFARQVAMAMEYLAEKKYVHRDLAARNVLLDYDKVVKVCDFGLSRDIFHDNQYKKLTNGKLPLKWMAIESLRDRVFTTQSDVWSFGILLWEIVTMGASPYPNIALADLYYVLSNFYRMDKPSNCSDQLYAIMRSCWEDNPLDRPSFSELRKQLEELMSQDRDYLVLEDIDVPLSASESSSNPTITELISSDMFPSQAAVDIVSESSGSSGSATAPAGAGLSRSGANPVPLFPRPACSGIRRPVTIDVCVHQKSTERLMRKSESDSSP